MSDLIPEADQALFERMPSQVRIDTSYWLYLVDQVLKPSDKWLPAEAIAEVSEHYEEDHTELRRKVAIVREQGWRGLVDPKVLANPEQRRASPPPASVTQGVRIFTSRRRRY